MYCVWLGARMDFRERVGCAGAIDCRGPLNRLSMHVAKVFGPNPSFGMRFNTDDAWFPQIATTNGALPQTEYPFRILPFPYRVVWLAGIYDVTREGTPTVAIVTRAARPDIIGVHHRMPVMFQEDAGQKWLDGDNLSDLLTKPYPHTLTVYPVTKDVNSPRHQGPQLHIPLLDNPLGP